jgi:hypothetical protein
VGTTNFDVVAASGGFTGDLTGNVIGAHLAATPVNVTASTLTATQAAHAGRVVTLNRAAGIAVTLPAASGSGSVFTFALDTTITSNSTTIKVANVSDAMTGTAYVLSDDAGAPVKGFRTAATDDTITLNGTTLGGLKGDLIVVRDVEANLFQVQVMSSATGTEATPFSATV